MSKNTSHREIQSFNASANDTYMHDTGSDSTMIMVARIKACNDGGFECSRECVKGWSVVVVMMDVGVIVVLKFIGICHD